MSVDPKQFCDALGRFASGVTVITSIHPDGRPVGVTVSAFASLSLAPPLILACLAKSSACLRAFSEGEQFAVNILAGHQVELSEAFARRVDDKYGGIDYRIAENGCPVLPGCLAVLQCHRHALHDGGDHLILVGRVERIEMASEGDPLVHYRGAYHRLQRPV